MPLTKEGFSQREAFLEKGIILFAVRGFSGCFEQFG
jgi:hypothetical protein